MEKLLLLLPTDVPCVLLGWKWLQTMVLKINLDHTITGLYTNHSSNLWQRIDSSKVRLGGLDSNLEELSKIDNMVFAACGTSLFASQYGAKLMRNLGSFDTCTTYDAAEFRIKDLPKKNGGIIAVSQSGETRDTLKVLKESSMIPRLSIVNVVGSAIARETKLGVYLNAGRENAVASTKAFTTQVTVMALVALWFKQVSVKLKRI